MRYLKTCCRCGEEKSVDGFHKNGQRGHHSWCKDCFNAYARETRKRKPDPEQRRVNNLWTRYRLRPDELERLTASQKGCCAICGGMWRLVVDHDHESGKVRGILCHGCNIKLPAIEDVEFRAAALHYLGRVA